MSYCVRCGAELREGVNFCEKCGAEVAAKGIDEVDDYCEGEESEVEDCDEEPEKGPPSDCYATFSGSCVSLYRTNGSLYRRIHVSQTVLGAQVSGGYVSITCAGGWHYLYTLEGALVRRTHR